MNPRPRRAGSPALIAFEAAAGLSLVLLAGLGPAAAQDTQYWTQQHGNAALLGGVAVANMADLSCVYYNPGALTLIPGEIRVMGTKSFTKFSLSIEDEQKKLDLSSSSIGRAPSFIAGRLDRREQPGETRWAYSILKRQDFDFRVQEPRSRSLVGEIGEVGGELLLEQELTERWFNVTWSRGIGSRFGVGITNVVAYRHQGRRSQIVLQSMGPEGASAGAILFDEFDFKHYRLLWKVGLAYDGAPLALGLTVTTPGIGLFGDASSIINRNVFGLDVDGDGSDDSRLDASSLEDVDSHFESPVSVAFGASYRFDRTTLDVTAEWFDRSDRFDVIDPQEYVAQSSGETRIHELIYELDSVFNVGGAIEHRFGEDLSFFGSFAADHTGAIPTSDREISLSNWDLYHITGGSVFKIGKSAVTLGLGYSFGSEDQTVQGDILDTAPRSALLGQLEGGESRDLKLGLTRWKLILGFSFL